MSDNSVYQRTFEEDGYEKKITITLLSEDELTHRAVTIAALYQIINTPIIRNDSRAEAISRIIKSEAEQLLLDYISEDYSTETIG